MSNVLVIAIIASAMIYNVSMTCKMMYQFTGGGTLDVVDEHTIVLSELDDHKPIFIDEIDETGKHVDGGKKVIDERSFPTGCSWKCYMNKNPDVIRSFKWSENALIRHYHKKGKLEGRSCGCDIAILAGPHDVVALSLQKVAAIYSDLKEIPWEWAELEKGLREDTIDHETLQIAYRKVVENTINEKGYNVILGLEDIDRLSKSANLRADLDTELENIAHEMFSIMPQSTIETGRATVYLNYRSPRVGSLVALWKEAFHGTKTFYEFLTSDDLNLFFNDIDIPLLARKMLKKGFKVKIIDVSGISEQYSSVVGCDMMGLQCSETNEQKIMMPNSFSNHKFRDEIMQKMSKFNKVNLDTKFDNMNVTTRHLDDIDILLKQYDCASLQQLISNDNSVDILYGEDLMGRMIECEHFDKKNLLTRQVLFNEIQKVFLNQLGDLIDNILDGKVIQ